MHAHIHTSTVYIIYKHTNIRLNQTTVNIFLVAVTGGDGGGGTAV